MTDAPRAQSDSVLDALDNLASASGEAQWVEEARGTLADALEAQAAEIARLKHELAMATDAANKGDDARTKAGAMQDQISDLRNIIAGMFWAGGNFDDKTTGEVRALGLDCRAERDALAALVKVARCPNNNCEDGIIPWVRGGVLETEPCQWCDERAKALRAPQTGGANDGQT